MFAAAFDVLTKTLHGVAGGSQSRNCEKSKRE